MQHGHNVVGVCVGGEGVLDEGIREGEEGGEEGGEGEGEEREEDMRRGKECCLDGKCGCCSNEGISSSPSSSSSSSSSQSYLPLSFVVASEEKPLRILEAPKLFYSLSSAECTLPSNQKESEVKTESSATDTETPLAFPICSSIKRFSTASRAEASTQRLSNIPVYDSVGEEEEGKKDDAKDSDGKNGINSRTEVSAQIKAKLDQIGFEMNEESGEKKNKQKEEKKEGAKQAKNASGSTASQKADDGNDPDGEEELDGEREDEEEEKRKEEGRKKLLVQTLQMNVPALIESEIACGMRRGKEEDEKEKEECCSDNSNCSVTLPPLPLEETLLHSTLWVEQNQLFGHPTEASCVCCSENTNETETNETAGRREREQKECSKDGCATKRGACVNEDGRCVCGGVHSNKALNRVHSTLMMQRLFSSIQQKMNENGHSEKICTRSLLAPAMRFLPNSHLFSSNPFFSSSFSSSAFSSSSTSSFSSSSSAILPHLPLIASGAVSTCSKGGVITIWAAISPKMSSVRMPSASSRLSSLASFRNMTGMNSSSSSSPSSSSSSSPSSSHSAGAQPKKWMRIFCGRVHEESVASVTFSHWGIEKLSTSEEEDEMGEKRNAEEEDEEEKQREKERKEIEEIERRIQQKERSHQNEANVNSSATTAQTPHVIEQPSILPPTSVSSSSSPSPSSALSTSSPSSSPSSITTPSPLIWLISTSTDGTVCFSLFSYSLSSSGTQLRPSPFASFSSFSAFSSRTSFAPLSSLRIGVPTLQCVFETSNFSPLSIKPTVPSPPTTAPIQSRRLDEHVREMNEKAQKQKAARCCVWVRMEREEGEGEGGNDDKCTQKGSSSQNEKKTSRKKIDLGFAVVGTDEGDLIVWQCDMNPEMEKCIAREDTESGEENKKTDPFSQKKITTSAKTETVPVEFRGIFHFDNSTLVDVSSSKASRSLQASSSSSSSLQPSHIDPITSIASLPVSSTTVLLAVGTKSGRVRFVSMSAAELDSSVESAAHSSLSHPMAIQMNEEQTEMDSNALSLLPSSFHSQSFTENIPQTQQSAIQTEAHSTFYPSSTVTSLSFFFLNSVCRCRNRRDRQHCPVCLMSSNGKGEEMCKCTSEKCNCEKEKDAKESERSDVMLAAASTDHSLRVYSVNILN